MSVRRNVLLSILVFWIGCCSFGTSGVLGDDESRRFPETDSNPYVSLEGHPSSVGRILPDNLPSVREWHVRPCGFIYGTYWASAAEPRLAVHLVEEQHTGTFLDSHIGGRLGLFRFGPKDQPQGFQVDILGGAKLRQDWDDQLDVSATDYRYDILGTYGAAQHRFKFGFYHVSSHVGDEFLLKTPTFHRLNFSRNTFVGGYSYFPSTRVRLYAETGWAFDHEICEPWEFQFGLEIGPQSHTGINGAPFLALNVHLREELEFGGNVAAQIGWAWRGEDEFDGTLRTGMYFYEGASPQFSFYAEHERQFGWGLWYDY